MGGGGALDSVSARENAEKASHMGRRRCPAATGGACGGAGGGGGGTAQLPTTEALRPYWALPAPLPRRPLDPRGGGGVLPT